MEADRSTMSAMSTVCAGLKPLLDTYDPRLGVKPNVHTQGPLAVRALPTPRKTLKTANLERHRRRRDIYDIECDDDGDGLPLHCVSVSDSESDLSIATTSAFSVSPLSFD